MMKKYHLADALTWTRLFCALALLFGSFTARFSATDAFLLFAFGELTDAFDGICARKWPYPIDGTYRWWRAYIKLIEPLFDIALGLSALLYIAIRLDQSLGLSLLVGSISVGLLIQIAAYGGVFHTVASARDWGLLRRHPAFAHSLLLFRRDILYSGIIAYVLIYLLWRATLSPEWKIGLTLIGAYTGANIWDLKSDRRSEIETH